MIELHLTDLEIQEQRINRLIELLEESEIDLFLAGKDLSEKEMLNIIDKIRDAEYIAGRLRMSIKFAQKKHATEANAGWYAKGKEKEK